MFSNCDTIFEGKVCAALINHLSGFGVKTPLRRALITNDFYFNSSRDIFEYLESNDSNQERHYYLLDKWQN